MIPSRHPSVSASVIASAALLLVSCGSHDTQTFDFAEAPPHVANEAITLRSAVETKMVEVEVQRGRSSSTELALKIQPITTTQPWIRIGAGWQVSDEHRSRDRYVSIGTVFVRIPKREAHEVRVPFLRLTQSRSAGIPLEGKLSRLPDGIAAEFVKTLNDVTALPPLDVVQIAVYAVGENTTYAALGSRVDPIKVLRAYELLKESGLDLNQFALWQTALDQLGSLTLAYERGVTMGGSSQTNGFDSFKEICHFYPFDAAAEIVVSSFDRHPGQRGIAFRTRAITALKRVGGAREIEVLQRVVRYEQDEVLYAQLTEFLTQQVASPSPR